MARNLAPKFSTFSKITQSVREILHEIHHTAVKIPNIMAMDNPVINIKKQTSAYNNKRHIANYTYRSPEYFTDYFKNYNEIKEHWNMVSIKDKKDIFLGAANLLENKYYDVQLNDAIVGVFTKL